MGLQLFAWRKAGRQAVMLTRAVATVTTLLPSRCYHCHSHQQTCGVSQYLTVCQYEDVLCACQILGKYKLSPVVPSGGSGEDLGGKVSPCAPHTRSHRVPQPPDPPAPPPLGLLGEPSFPKWEGLECCPQRSPVFPSRLATGCSSYVVIGTHCCVCFFC